MGLLIYYKEKNEGNQIEKLQFSYDKLQKSDKELKKLISLIPNGIAVLNLHDISHFNQAFVKILGKKDNLQLTNKLNQLKRKIDNNSIFEQYNDNQDMNFSPNNRETNLLKDLQKMFQDMKFFFKNEPNIFMTYYKEKFKFFNGMSSHRQSASSSSKKCTKVYIVSMSRIKWGGKMCVLLTTRDITSQRLVTQKEVINKLQNMIFKSYAHELKTPLNGISLPIQTSLQLIEELSYQFKDNKQILFYIKNIQNQLSVINSNQLILKCTISDFFDFNLLQNDELKIKIEAFNLKDCIQECVDAVYNQIDKQQIKFDLKFHISEELKSKYTKQMIIMFGDYERLQQILMNLLMNSIKFTQKGQIKLQIMIVSSQNIVPLEVVQFYVIDTGYGIEQKRHKNIFNLFERDEDNKLEDYIDSRNRSAKMGLPLSQNLCHLLGGRISVESQLKQGSQFYFTLPLDFRNSAQKVNQDQMNIINQQLKNNDNKLQTLSSNESESALMGSIEDCKQPINKTKRQSYLDKVLTINTNKDKIKKSFKPDINTPLLDDEQIKVGIGQFDLIFSKDSLHKQQVFKDVQKEEEEKVIKSKNTSFFGNFFQMKSSNNFLLPFSNDKQDDRRISGQFGTQQNNTSPNQMVTMKNVNKNLDSQSSQNKKENNKQKFEDIDKYLFESQENVDLDYQIPGYTAILLDNENIESDRESAMKRPIYPPLNIFSPSKNFVQSTEFKKNIINENQEENKDMIIEETKLINNDDIQEIQKNKVKDSSINLIQPYQKQGIKVQQCSQITGDPQDQLKIQELQSFQIKPKINISQQSYNQKGTEEYINEQFAYIDQILQQKQQQKLSQTIMFDIRKSQTQDNFSCCPQVLIVDDIYTNREALREMLKLCCGIKSIEASNGQECLTMIQEYYENKTCQCQGIKVIFMDIEMPIMDGYQASRNITRLMQSKILPQDIIIIAYTAYLDEREKCLSYGMTDFLVKPTKLQVLNDMLLKYIKF